MKRNGYKISIFILGIIFLITLSFLLYTVRKPPNIYDGFTNNGIPSNKLDGKQT